MKTKINLGLAIAVSAVCAAMAAAAAADRAVTSADQVMLTAAAVALALGSHLIPTLAPKNALGHALFIGCITATIYNHAHYFERQSHRAGQHRAESIPASNAAAALQSELSTNAARPLPTVSADLAKAMARAANAKAELTRCESKCTGLEAADQAAKAKVAALTDERTAALRADEIRHKLAALATTADTSRTSAAQNPVDAVIADMTGIDVQKVGFLSAVLQSLMLEVMAALLWSTALASKTAEKVGENAPAPKAKQAQRQALPAQAELPTVPKAQRQTRKPRDSPPAARQTRQKPTAKTAQ